MPDDTVLILPDAEIEALAIPPADVAAAVEAAVLAEARGTVLTAPKAALLPGDGRYMMATLSTADDPAATVVKCVTVAPGNAALGLPGIEGAITVFDPRTGRPAALLGAGWVTGARTAALSALAARRMADPGSRVIAFVGCGLQARTHLAAFAELFPLAEVRALGRGAASRERLIAEATRTGLAAHAAGSAQEALEGADLVVSSITLDYSVEPFLDARWLKPGAFAAVTDLGIPWTAEGNPAFGRIVVDDLAQEAESPRKLCDPALVTGDLKGLLTGALPSGPTPDAPSAFFFRGVAVGDFAAAALVLERARAAGAGTALPW